jgi:hypothetical protein
MSKRTSKRTMKDVNHKPPSGTSVTNVWQRGRKPEAHAED